MEAGRKEFRRDGVPNVDLVLTTQEVIKMIKESGIRFQMLEKESPRSIWSSSFAALARP